jgi:hypothetical protein
MGKIELPLPPQALTLAPAQDLLRQIRRDVPQHGSWLSAAGAEYRVTIESLNDTADALGTFYREKPFVLLSIDGKTRRVEPLIS